MPSVITVFPLLNNPHPPLTWGLSIHGERLVSAYWKCILTVGLIELSTEWRSNHNYIFHRKVQNPVCKGLNVAWGIDNFIPRLGVVISLSGLVAIMWCLSFKTSLPPRGKASYLNRCKITTIISVQ